MISQQQMDDYKKQMKDQVAIGSYVDKLIEERKDPEVTAETLPIVRDLLIKKTNEAINEHLISLLSDADVLELDKLLDAKATEDQLNDFFRAHVDNVSIEIATALLNFRAAYLYPVWKKQQEEASAKLIAEEQKKKSEKVEVGSLPPAPVA